MCLLHIMLVDNVTGLNEFERHPPLENVIKKLSLELITAGKLIIYAKLTACI